MNIAHYISTWWKEALEYKERVLKDGGTTKREDNVQRYYQMCKEQGMLNSIKFAWLGEAGGKFRTSGANQFWTKAYSLVTTNDATQTTSTLQPYISGNIAPNEKLCLKNVNGDNRYMTHPTISFAANEAWSVTTVVNDNASNLVGSKYYAAGSIYIALLADKTIQRLYVLIDANELIFTTTTSKFLGKNTVITLVANGIGNITAFINGVSLETKNIQTGGYLNKILYGMGGTISAHIIRAQALTPSQVAAEANFLRSLYPEIPSVTIGTQTWATSNCDMAATPQGNLIQNVTANTNVEKITNAADREFSSDTGFWSKDTGTSISGGVCNFVNVVNGQGINKGSFVTIGKWYKYTYTLAGSIINFRIKCGSGGLGITRTAAGTYVEYISAAASSAAEFTATSSTNNFTLDDVSIQEVGWSDSTNLYDYVYANTAGTTEQKTYAAVKAAAFWRYPSNDVALGSVYGKKYNKYALKLLAEDIAAYNSANPTTPWLWDVPTQAQLTTLAAIGGNAAKKDGTNYWTTANGTNSSGFTALGGGYIASNGTTTNLKSSEYIGCKDADIAREIKDGDDTFNEVEIAEQGVSIRLIKP